MLNIVWGFWIEFYKITVGIQCHKPNNTDLPQLIEQVHLLDKVYQKSVKLTKKAMKVYEKGTKRSETLPKWDVAIRPVLG